MIWMIKKTCDILEDILRQATPCKQLADHLTFVVQSFASVSHIAWQSHFKFYLSIKML